ncbi:MAG: insulinase family protein [Chthoniobacterales bacterium]|nr:insulinase family protein [Chthoniobacterales bacterium]
MDTKVHNEPKLTCLPNGVTVATLQAKEHQSVAMAVWARVGLRHESPEQSGISHFLEHILFKGSQKRTSWQISAAVEGHGGDINAQTAEEWTGFYALSPAHCWRKIADVLIEMVACPRISDESVEIERGVILDEIRMCNDDTEQRAWELLNGVFWENSSLRLPISGTIESVSRITAADLRAYHQKYYGGKNLLLTAVGPVKHESFVGIAGRYLANLGGGERSLSPGALPNAGPVLTFEPKPTEQVQVSAAYPIPGYLSEERYPLAILQVILGGNFCSRLNQELRERRGWCYHAGAGLHQLSDAGMLHLTLGVEPANLLECLRALRKILLRLAEKGCSAAEVRRASEYLIGSAELSLERSTVRNSRLAHSIMAFGRYIPDEEWRQKLRAVTVPDVQAVAQRYLVFQNFKLALVGPEIPQKQIRKLFFGDAPVSWANPVFAQNKPNSYEKLVINY